MIKTKCRKCLKEVSKINKIPPHRWTTEEKEYLGEITPGRHYKEILDLMNKKFEYKFRLKQIEKAIFRFGYKTGIDTKYQKGHEPWSKGTKGLIKPNKTSFQKGCKPWNEKEIGSEKINSDGYVEVKIDKSNKWKLKQRVMYEKYHNVKLMPDDVVIFADKNKLNFEKDNLILVSKKKLLTMNKNNLIFNDKELTKTGVNIAELMIKINEREK